MFLTGSRSVAVPWRCGRAMRGALRNLGLSLAVTAAARTAAGQTSVSVRDVAGTPVPFATLTVMGGATFIADDSGQVSLRAVRSDSVQLWVRRIGFREYFGWQRVRGVGRVDIVLPAIAATIDAVVVSARRDTPLARTGFYDRARRVREGAIVGEFLTPEDLDFRDAASASSTLTGARYVRIGRVGLGRPVLLGRGGCAMTLIVDGQRVPGMIEELAVEQVPTSIIRNGTRQSTQQTEKTLLDIDQVLDGRSIMAVEIYPSTANAPAELQTLGGRGSCGIVAIWTGPRQ